MNRDDLDLLARSLRHAITSSTAGAVDAALLALGWPDALADDPRAAISTLFELQGAHHTTSSSLGLVLADALGMAVAADGGFLIPVVGGADPPGRFAGDRLHVDGLMPAAAASWPTVSVVAVRGDEHVVAAVPPSALRVAAITGLDPAGALQRVTGADLITSTTVPLDAVRWTAAVARGRLAVAHELVGASRTMLELARTHALERVQFGRPISAFQAVRHRLAEALVAIEVADASLDAGWLDGSPRAAAMAKATAGRSARTVARHSQQVLAGIGFTTEHDFHHHLRRTVVLDALLGSSVSLTRDLGADLLCDRHLPPLLPL